ncbi:sensor histidine kinase [Variovorax ginsengisoli]|uniref:Signal transduction histidine kinase n=1 Tax=Variovorax ginsengisoli TaxID=363844 RepID=A0ABT9S792_9BURK|nr:histidine kinase [Variovorax ginsengisoli]MDP9899207.1 signal transduction histidine kinase [Variovorax ginsengisoli]
MTIRWQDATRHYLQVVAACCAIAVLTNMIWPLKGYLPQLGYALSVGTISWMVIEFGRYLVPERHCRRASHGGRGWPQGWRGLLLTAVSIGLGFIGGQRFGDLFWSNGLVNSPRDDEISLTITILAGAIISFYFHSRGRAAELVALKNAAERSASEAKLKLLETQLEPHMLFNTLANLRVLITTDPPRAVAMLDRLNSYLRVTLTGSRALAHPLAAEFERLSDYLELMSVRMGKRLRYTMELPDDLRQVPVPPLLLQPLVENSIRHGLEPKVEGGEITVRAHRHGAQLVIEVLDTGVGLVDPPGSSNLGIDGDDMGGGGFGSSGFGITQVRERLSTVHQDRAHLQLSRRVGGGTAATLTLPLTEQSPPP